MAVREVAFELECFEWADERLEVAGRWKGLGSRRLARAVLTVDVASGRRKRLAALPGGQFAPTAESWRAAFAWPGDPAEIIGAELEVGGNVVVELPLPDRRRRRRKRAAAEAGDEALRAELAALHAQVERLRGELAGRERENMQLQARLDEGENGDPGAAAGASTVEIERLSAAREQELTAELERLAEERDRTHADLRAEIERLHGERDRWKEEIDELRQAFSDAAAEAEAAREHHRAELSHLEAELSAESAAVARLSAELAARPEPPPPITESARRAAAGPPTEAMPPPGEETTEVAPPPATAPEPTEPLGAIVDAASVPGALDPPGPLRAGSRPASQPGGEEVADESRIPAWLRSGRAGGEENAALGPSAGAFATREAEADTSAAPARKPNPALHALKQRLEHLFVPNGHAEAEEHDATPGVPRPRRSAAAARARAGATVAARRSPAELWALRVLAAALVAVLLIAFLLIVTRIA
jgi:hypothetical protein